LTLLALTLPAHAGPRELTYQGQLYQAGMPVDALQEFRFSMWAGGSEVWQSGATVTTMVQYGFFSVRLGDPSVMNPLPVSIFDGSQDVYLRIEVGNPGDTLTTLTPDKKIVSAAYSICADSVNGVLIAHDSGVALNAQDRPFVTRGWDIFTSGSYSNLGRWGLFMEPHLLTLGFPADLTPFKGVQIAGYCTDSTISNVVLTALASGNVGIGVPLPNAKLQVDGVVAGVNIEDNLAGRPYLTYANANNIYIRAGTSIKIGARIFHLATYRDLYWSDLDTGSEQGGKDYHVIACDNNGTLEVKIHLTTAYNDYLDAAQYNAGGLTYPPGYNASNARVIGGFHNEATDTSGTAGSIKQYSVWDLNNRAACPDPRGMVRARYKRLWYDIYLASSWYGNTEAYGDPFSDPAYKVRSVYQANIWGNMHWYDAQQQGHNSGKRLLMYDEFIEMASGTVESNTFGTLVGRTGGNSLNGRRLVSLIGAEDCAGVRKQWGREIGAGAGAATSYGVHGDTFGHGYILSYHAGDPIAPLFGGACVVGISDPAGGSRCIYYDTPIWSQNSMHGARYGSEGL
jgi:hypothetical protein